MTNYELILLEEENLVLTDEATTCNKYLPPGWLWFSFERHQVGSALLLQLATEASCVLLLYTKKFKIRPQPTW